MSDTSPDIERRMTEMMAERSPGERLRMASDMFETARALMRCGLRMQYPSISDGQLKAQMFLRLYGQDFSASEIKRIMARIPGMEPGVRGERQERR